MSEFLNYERNARSTALYPSLFDLIYPTLGLVGEAGEVVNKVKKLLRDNYKVKLENDVKLQEASEIVEKAINDIIHESNFKEILKAELGDVLWYIVNTANDVGLSLKEVADYNNQKLLDRMARNKIAGSGDDR